jgi:hypothetical protein
MRTLRDLEIDTELENDPMGGGDDLGNTEINDPSE